MTHAGYADYLADRLGWRVTPEAVERWKQENAPPGDVLVASVEAARTRFCP